MPNWLDNIISPFRQNRVSADLYQQPQLYGQMFQSPALRMYEGEQPDTRGQVNSVADRIRQQQQQQILQNQQLTRLETPAFDEYRNYLNTYPRRESVRPGIWDRIAAGLGGASSAYFKGPEAGILTSRNMMEFPYQRAVSDWMGKAEPMYQAAQTESQNLGREASLYNYLSLDRYRQDSIGAREEANRIREANSIRNFDVAKMRANMPDWEAQAPTKDGTGFVVMNTKTREVQIVPIDTFDDVDKAAAALQRVNAAGSWNVLAAGTPRTSTVFSYGSGGSNQGYDPARNSALRTTVSREALQAVAAKNPNWVSKWVYQHPTNLNLMIRFPDADTPAAEQADFQRFFAELDRWEKQLTPPAVAPTRPNLTPPGAGGGNTGGGTVMMKDPRTGKTGPVRAENVAAAKADGYVVVTGK